MKKNWIKRWIICTKDGEIQYILDADNIDASDEEISMCIQEQIYGWRVE